MKRMRAQARVAGVGPVVLVEGIHEGKSRRDFEVGRVVFIVAWERGK